MQLARRRAEWQVIKGLCRGLSDPLWRPLWAEVALLRPEVFTHADLGRVFTILNTFHDEPVRLAAGLPVVLQNELAAVGLGGFSVDGLLSPVPTDLGPPELIEEVRGLLRAHSRIP